MSAQRIVLLALSVSTVAACGDGNGPSPPTTLSQEEAGRLGFNAYMHLYSTVSGMREFRLVYIHPCVPELSDPAYTDSDGDRVFDDQTYTYTPANCTFSEPNGVQHVITGTRRIQDTDGGTIIFGSRETFDIEAVGHQGGVEVSAESGAGSSSVAVTSTGASAEEDVTDTNRGTGQGLIDPYDYAVHMAWSSSFTPTSGTIDPTSGQFPAGTFLVEGTYTWTGTFRGVVGPFQLELVTSVPLVSDPACPDPFSDGELRFALAASHGKTGFTVRPQGCPAVLEITPFDER